MKIWGQMKNSFLIFIWPQLSKIFQFISRRKYEKRFFIWLALGPLWSQGVRRPNQQTNAKVWKDWEIWRGAVNWGMGVFDHYPAHDLGLMTAWILSEMVFLTHVIKILIIQSWTILKQFTFSLIPLFKRVLGSWLNNKITYLFLTQRKKYGVGNFKKLAIMEKS